MARRSRPKALSPKHRWTDIDRLELSILHICFGLHPKHIVKVFNHGHRSELLNEGFEGGMTLRPIYAQIQEFRRGGTGSQIYQLVDSLPKSTIHDIFAVHINTLRRTARQLGVDLNSEHRPPHHKFRIPPVANHRRQSKSLVEQIESVDLSEGAEDSEDFEVSEDSEGSETSITTWLPDPDDSDLLEEEDYTPTRSGRSASQYVSIKIGSTAKGYLSPMVSPRTAGVSSLRRPYFVYRAFDITHGLNARRFLDAHVLSIPPRFQSRAFANDVRPHLERDITFQSPFLSLTQFPRAAIKYLFAKVAEGSQMALAIFTYDDLRKDNIKRFGHNSGPYLVPVICREYNFYDLPGRYVGRGEFLTWGSIGCEPVAVISGIDSLMIRAILNTTKEFNFEAGRRLHQYLPRIDKQQLELFLYQLVTGSGSKIKDRKLARRTEAYDEFIRGAVGADDQMEGESVSSSSIFDIGHEPIDDESILQVVDGNPDETQSLSSDSMSTVDYEILSTPPSTRRSYAEAAWRDD